MLPAGRGCWFDISLIYFVRPFATRIFHTDAYLLKQCSSKWMPEVDRPYYGSLCFLGISVHPEWDLSFNYLLPLDLKSRWSIRSHEVWYPKLRKSHRFTALPSISADIYEVTWTSCCKFAAPEIFTEADNLSRHRRHVLLYFQTVAHCDAHKIQYPH